MNNQLLLIASLTSLLLLPACSTPTYVANVAFDQNEICSKELASAFKSDEGCLPPIRVENVQQMYFRIRPQISPAQATELDRVANSHAEAPNFLPSLLGAVFVAAADEKTKKVSAPRTGNFEFLPLSAGVETKPSPAGKEKNDNNDKAERGERQGRKPGASETVGNLAPNMEMKVEIPFRTDLGGAVDKQSTTEIKMDAGKIVDAALQSAGIPVNKGTESLREALVSSVMVASYKAHKFDEGSGSYMYVTLTANELDSLNHMLSICNLTDHNQVAESQSQQPAFQAEILAPVKNLTWEEDYLCNAGMNSNRISRSTKQLVFTLLDLVKSRPEIHNVGIIVGLGILRTQGKSELCSEEDFGIIARGEQSGLSTSTCASLKTALDTKVALNSEPGSPTILGGAQRAGIVMSITAQLSEKTYKRLNTYEHASVMAIQWIPISVNNEIVLK